MLKNIQVDFDLSRFATADHRVNETSSIATKMYRDDATFPKTYCLENTRMHQLWWDTEEFNMEKISGDLGFDVKTISSIVIPPGSTIPLHSDTFHKLRSEFPDETDRMVRAVIYATPFDIGQMTQYVVDGTLYASAGWQTGEGMIWDDQVPHVTVNGGMTDLCTVNFTGFMKEE
jgi:hypothetical protein